MTVAMNDMLTADFANRELSIDELDAIAAGLFSNFSWGGFGKAVGAGAGGGAVVGAIGGSFLGPGGAAFFGAALGAEGAVMGAWGYLMLHLD
jgi:hypothetical protein